MLKRLAFVPILVGLGYIALICSMHVYVSGGYLADAESFSFTWDFLQDLNLEQVPSIPSPSTTHVDQLELQHAIVNALFVLSTCFLLGLLPIALLLMGIVAMILGLVLADQSGFLMGILALVMAPVSLLVVVMILPVFLWGVLLFQPCTPAYGFA